MITQEKIDSKLQKDISHIVKRILFFLPSKPDAILLCGGYGRDEGGWIECENGEISPWNDYDIAIVSKSKYPREETNIIRKQLAEELGLKWVDITYYNTNKIPYLKNTIHNFDLLYASKHIYGDFDIYSLFPKIEPKKIGIFDIEVLYKTRIWTLLGSWIGEFHDLDEDEAMFFKNQMAKCILAICDMLLVTKNRYQSSYQKRAEDICELYKENDDFCKKVRWAIAEKLRPSRGELKLEEMQRLYNEVKSCFVKVSEIALGPLWKYYYNPLKYKKYALFNSKFIATTLYHWILGKNEKSLKVIDVFVAQNLVLLGEKDGVINKEYISKASEILLKWNYIDHPIKEWNYLHNAVADARNNL